MKSRLFIEPQTYVYIEIYGGWGWLWVGVIDVDEGRSLCKCLSSYGIAGDSTKCG